MNPQTYTATVSKVSRVAGDFYLARFTLVDPKEIRFQAGQYVTFVIPLPKKRHIMSIASLPSKAREIEILQGVAPMGDGSKWVLGLKAGDAVQFLGPLGTFVLQKESPRPKVFVATGCGIAPIRSMILDHPSGTLYWGLRYETDIFWQDEFAALAKEHPAFRFMITLSKPTETWKGGKGRVTDHVIAETQNLTKSEFYLCGSRQMIIDMRELLTENGVPADQIFMETFF